MSLIKSLLFTIHLLEHPVPPVFNTKYASQTGNFAYPH